MTKLIQVVAHIAQGKKAYFLDIFHLAATEANNRIRKYS